jgi:hypothetical protein
VTLDARMKALWLLVQEIGYRTKDRSSQQLERENNLKKTPVYWRLQARTVAQINSVRARKWKRKSFVAAVKTKIAFPMPAAVLIQQYYFSSLGIDYRWTLLTQLTDRF